MLEKIEREIENWKLPLFIENTLLGLLAFFFSTLIHELGHVLTATVLGCNAGIKHVGMIMGASGIAECASWKLSIIALGGPLTAFIFGLYFWYSEGENSRLRFLSIILFTLSSVIQLIPRKPLDGYWAIYYGMPPFIELLIFITLFAIAVNLIIDEIRT